MSGKISLDNFIKPSDLGLPDPDPNQLPASPPSDIAQVKAGIDLIKRWEGLELTAYPDPATQAEPYTIGYGRTRHDDGTPIRPGETVTQQQAESMLMKQIERDFLPALQTVPHWSAMAPHQKGALLSYAWNMGTGFIGDRDNFATINRALDAKDWAAVPDALMLYVKGGGRFMLGLKRRRYSEAALWQGKSVEVAYESGIAIIA